MLGSTSGLLLSLSPQHDEDEYDEYLGEVTNSEYGSSDISLPASDLVILLLLLGPEQGGGWWGV